MLLRKTHTRRLSRLIAGLFAVQIVVTGFCLLTSQAHATSMNPMPMAQMSVSQMSDSAMGDMAGHCNKPAHMNGQHDGTSHSGGCFHCDEPDQFVKAGSADVAPVSLVLTCLAVLPELLQWTATSELPLVYTPTGPPDSSSLLFTTTQRIRV
jgi:hypothetical protein